MGGVSEIVTTVLLVGAVAMGFGFVAFLLVQRFVDRMDRPQEPGEHESDAPPRYYDDSRREP
jgi:hypothetical protein